MFSLVDSADNYEPQLPNAQTTVPPVALAPNVVVATEDLVKESLIGVAVDVAVVCMQPTESVEVALSEVVTQTVPELVNCVVEACASVVAPVTVNVPPSAVAPVPLTVRAPSVVMSVLIVVVA